VRVFLRCALPILKIDFIFKQNRDPLAPCCITRSIIHSQNETLIKQDDYRPIAFER
jgi:hypothetical protein